MKRLLLNILILKPASRPAIILVGLALGLITLAPFHSAAQADSAAGSELGALNLKGFQYLTPAIVFNSVICGEAYTDKNEDDSAPCQLAEAQAQAEKVACPLRKQDFLELYQKMSQNLQATEVQLLKLRRYPGAEEKSTVIPMLLLYVDTLPPTKAGENHPVSLHLALHKWTSTWVDAGRIVAPVYTWSAKKLIVLDPKTFKTSLEAAIAELINLFVSEYRSVNPSENPAPQIPSPAAGKGKSKK